MNQTKAKNIVVKPHAVKRLSQRFCLYMTESERLFPETFILGQFKNSYVDMKTEQSVFRKSVLEREHGKGSFISKNKNFVFGAVYDRKTDTVFIRTMWRIKKN